MFVITFIFFPLIVCFEGFPGGSADKESTCTVGDLDSVPGSGRSPGEGKGYPLLILAWRAPWTGLTKRWTRTERLSLSLWPPCAFWWSLLKEYMQCSGFSRGKRDRESWEAFFWIFRSVKALFSMPFLNLLSHLQTFKHFLTIVRMPLSRPEEMLS